MDERNDKVSEKKFPKFITGNKGKLEEAREILSGVEQLDIDLEEIQELDPRLVIEAKLKEAQKVVKGDFFCEDTSLYIEKMNGFPGPLIKWYMKAIGVDGIYNQTKVLDNCRAVAKTVIGYSCGDDIKFFEGIIEGEIVEPAGERGFGWDKIFRPNGFDKTFSQMSIEEKNKISMRRNALNKLKDYLN